VTILADIAERAEEIDIQHAEEARKRAQDSLANRGSATTDVAAMAEMRRAVVRLRVARGRGRMRGGPESGV
jgi:F-type H+-transporting ATPase subunit epsilon